MALRAKLQVIGSPQGKHGKPLLPWLDELFQVIEDLHTLRDPATEKEVRQYLYAALKVDLRYADFVRDATEFPDMSIVDMRTLLAAVNEALVAEVKVELKVVRAAADSGKPVTQQLAHPPVRQEKGGKGRAEGQPTTSQDGKTTNMRIQTEYLNWL